MCRVLIVDDEPIAVESVVYMIKKNFDNIDIVGTSRSGKDAIEKAYNLHPDIIIMDINMPGINGLDAMKQIRMVNQNVSFIVITAFDYFDYAVESVTLGVEEYLLKPVKEAKFIETLKKVINQINTRKLNFKRNLEQQERLEMIIPILETGFMNSLCMYGDNTKELQSYCDLFGYNKSSGYVMAIEFGQKQSKKIENKIGAGVQGEKMYEEYKKIIRSYCTCIVGPIMLNQIIVYVFDDSMEESFEQKSKSVRLAKNIIDRASKLYPDIFIGIGRFHTSIRDAKKSYQEALYALRILSASEEDENTQYQILHIDDNLEETEYTESDYEHQIEEEIFSKVAEGNEAAIQMSFKQLYTRMCADDKMNFTAVKNRMIAMIIGFGKRWGDILGDYYELLSDIINAYDEDNLYQICKGHISGILHKITFSRQNKVNSIIEKANQYIEEHYKEEISLEDVAKEVNLSSYYFSRFYKEETGSNFTDKLSSVRIEKAKELLKDKNLSIKDVCFMVGYMEPNYFSKIFKKVTGYTASDYKRLFG